MLTYCTNIHPGETWADVRSNLESHLLAVKASVSPNCAFPIGLRLSNRASLEIDDTESKRFKDWCDANDCFVLTVNGFPYGRFHGPGVKERVYSPDWRDPDRVDYLIRLADHLADWLPNGVDGSISTVPIAFKRGFREEDWTVVRRHIQTVLEHLASVFESRGARIMLSIEPEPGCVVETTPDVIAFFDRMAFREDVGSFLGICFDCCHQAVEFEDASLCLTTLEQANIPIGKVQVSSSLKAVGDEIAALARFDEPSFLHQVVARARDGTFRRYDDLPDFLAAGFEDVEECRVHFHVPIFAEHLGHCGTTQDFLEEILPILAPSIPLEVETYSWDVLPRELRMESVTESIARELEWVMKRVYASDRRT